MVALVLSEVSTVSVMERVLAVFLFKVRSLVVVVAVAEAGF